STSLQSVFRLYPLHFFLQRFFLAKPLTQHASSQHLLVRLHYLQPVHNQRDMPSSPVPLLQHFVLRANISSSPFSTSHLFSLATTSSYPVHRLCKIIFILIDMRGISNVRGIYITRNPAVIRTFKKASLSCSFIKLHDKDALFT